MRNDKCSLKRVRDARDWFPIRALYQNSSLNSSCRPDVVLTTSTILNLENTMQPCNQRQCHLTSQITRAYGSGGAGAGHGDPRRHQAHCAAPRPSTLPRNLPSRHCWRGCSAVSGKSISRPPSRAPRFLRPIQEEGVGATMEGRRHRSLRRDVQVVSPYKQSGPCEPA